MKRFVIIEIILLIVFLTLITAHIEFINLLISNINTLKMINISIEPTEQINSIITGNIIRWSILIAFSLFSLLSILAIMLCLITNKFPIIKQTIKNFKQESKQKRIKKLEIELDQLKKDE